MFLLNARGLFIEKHTSQPRNETVAGVVFLPLMEKVSPSSSCDLSIEGLRTMDHRRIDFSFSCRCAALRFFLRL